MPVLAPLFIFMYFVKRLVSPPKRPRRIIFFDGSGQAVFLDMEDDGSPDSDVIRGCIEAIES